MNNRYLVVSLDEFTARVNADGGDLLYIGQRQTGRSLCAAVLDALNDVQGDTRTTEFLDYIETDTGELQTSTSCDFNLHYVDLTELVSLDNDFIKSPVVKKVFETNHYLFAKHELRQTPIFVNMVTFPGQDTIMLMKTPNKSKEAETDWLLSAFKIRNGRYDKPAIVRANYTTIENVIKWLWMFDLKDATGKFPESDNPLYFDELSYTNLLTAHADFRPMILFAMAKELFAVRRGLTLVDYNSEQTTVTTFSDKITSYGYSND